MKILHIKPKHMNLFDLLLFPLLLAMRFILSMSLGMHSHRDYDSVDDEIIEIVLRIHLPKLKKTIGNIIKNQKNLS